VFVISDQKASTNHCTRLFNECDNYDGWDLISITGCWLYSIFSAL